MDASEQIIAKQLEWAHNQGLRLTGSRGSRGRKAYTTNLQNNLFQSLNIHSRIELEEGDGGELKSTEKWPAKIQALHSSSALGINVFDYWRGSADLSIISSSCGLSRRSRSFTGDIRFEQKLPIDSRFRYSPNIDVVILPASGTYKCFAIECKFTEAYSGRGHGGLDGKYLENEQIWQGLPATWQLAQDISPNDSQFNFLHAAQLIKHILGLNRKYGRTKYRLLYLSYDAFGEAGFQHGQEVGDFARIVRSDGIAFHHTTYQDLIIRLAQHREKHREYVGYLTDRYL